jgi:fatty-acyl-CoA synthase
MIDIASENGFDGIEPYHVSAAPSLTDKGGPFHVYSVASTYRMLRSKKLSIPCFDSALDITSQDESVMDLILDEMKLCSDMRSPYIAVWAS